MTLSFIDYRGQTPTKVEQGIRLITAKNVKKGFISMEPEEFISESTYRSWMSRGLPKVGDVLFTTEAPMGNAAVVRTAERFALAQRIICFRPYAPISTEFLALLLLSDSFQAILDRTATGLTAKGIKAAKLKRLPIPLPPLAEQRRIVARVDELMALCDRLEEAQAELDFRRQRLTRASIQAVANSDGSDFNQSARFYLSHFSKLTALPEQIRAAKECIFRLAVRGKLVEQDPSDEPASSTLGQRSLQLDNQSAPWQLPPGWAWFSLALIGETIGGGTPSKADPSFWQGPIPWVSPKDMKSGEILDSQDHISEAALRGSAAKLIPPNSLLLVVRGMILAHSFPTAINTVPVTINQDMKAVRPFCDDLMHKLLLLTKGLKRAVLKLVQRSTHGTCKLLTDDLFSLPLPIPPLAEQNRILKRTQELIATLESLERELQESRTCSTALLKSLLHHALQEVPVVDTDFEEVGPPLAAQG